MSERMRIQRKREKVTTLLSAQSDTLQRSPLASLQDVDEVPSIVQEVLSSSGQPLDVGTQGFMESRFGHNFSQVRVHTDERAVESAQAVNALAYTMGRDVVFGEGQYVPGTSEGKRLLAHELTHVVQQTSSRMADTAVLENIAFNDPTDHFERIADQAADSVIAERHSTTTEKRTLTSPALEGTDKLNSIPTIQRKVDTLSPPESDTTANVPTTMTEGGQQKQQKPIISPETEAQMHTDVEFIVGKLREQILLAREEWEILGVIEKWVSEDGRYQQMTGYQGSDYLDKFLLMLKLRTYTRNTIRSAWVTQWASVYDDLWHELEDERLDKFKSLLARSHKQATPGPESERMENIWASLGKKEAIAMFGMLKGMGTGLAGMADTGAWAITKAMRAAGLEVSDPESASKWLGEQYDFSGNELFGKEWTEGEALLLGMNAKEIGTAGGGVIWNLVTIGAGGATGTSKWAGMALKGFGVLGSLKGVEESANAIANLVWKMQEEGTLTAGNLLTNGEFILEATKMATSIFGAVSGGSEIGGSKATDAVKVAEAISATMKRVGILLDVAEMTAQVSRIAEIGASTMSPEEKEKATSQLVIDLINKGLAVTHQTTEYRKQFGSVEPTGHGEPPVKPVQLLDQYERPVSQEPVTSTPGLVDQYGRPATGQEPATQPVHLLDEYGRPVEAETISPVSGSKDESETAKVTPAASFEETVNRWIDEELSGSGEVESPGAKPLNIGDEQPIPELTPVRSFREALDSVDLSRMTAAEYEQLRAGWQRYMVKPGRRLSSEEDYILFVYGKRTRQLPDVNLIGSLQVEQLAGLVLQHVVDGRLPPGSANNRDIPTPQGNIRPDHLPPGQSTIYLNPDGTASSTPTNYPFSAEFVGDSKYRVDVPKTNQTLGFVDLASFSDKKLLVFFVRWQDHFPNPSSLVFDTDLGGYTLSQSLTEKIVSPGVRDAANQKGIAIQLVSDPKWK